MTTIFERLTESYPRRYLLPDHAFPLFAVLSTVLKKEAIERQIEKVDVKVEALEGQSRQVTTPLLEKAQKEGCLRG